MEIARGLLIYCRVGLQANELHIEGADTVTECTGISVPWGLGGNANDKLSLVLVYRPPRDPLSLSDQGNTDRLCSKD